RRTLISVVADSDRSEWNRSRLQVCPLDEESLGSRENLGPDRKILGFVFEDGVDSSAYFRRSSGDIEDGSALELHRRFGTLFQIHVIALGNQTAAAKEFQRRPELGRSRAGGNKVDLRSSVSKFTDEGLGAGIKAVFFHDV